MRVLFDQGTPVPLRNLLKGHDISTAYELGWSTLKNGELIAAAEASAFEVMVTTDTNLRYQQNLSGRTLAIVVLTTTSWPRIRKVIDRIASAIDSATQGSYAAVAIP